jgi:cytochrome c-type biogenesis protein CcmH
MKLGRYAESVRAWRDTLQLLGESADREASLGEALMAEANGIVTAEAKDAFVRAVVLDKATVSARYYLGVAAEQDGKREEAAKIWRACCGSSFRGAWQVTCARRSTASRAKLSRRLA